MGAASALSGHMSRHLKRQTEAGKGVIEAMVATPFWCERLDITEVMLDAFTGLAIFKVGSEKADTPLKRGQLLIV